MQKCCNAFKTEQIALVCLFIENKYFLMPECLNSSDTYGFLFIKQEELTWQFLNAKCAVEISR